MSILKHRLYSKTSIYTENQSFFGIRYSISKHNLSFTSFSMFRFYSKYFCSNNISFRNLCLVTSRKFLHSCSEHKIGDDIANSTVINGKNTRSNSVITETGDFDPSENDFETIKKKNKTALNKATSELINSRESLRKMKDLFKRSFEDQARNGPSYLCDEIVARNVCESIKRSMTSTDLPVLECNPGAGFLTKELIDAGINNLQLFEPNSIFFSYLTKKFPGLQIHKKNVSKLWKLLYLDGIDGGTRTADVFSGIKARSWDEDPSYCLIAAIDGTNFVKSFIIGIMVQENMYQCGKPECYLILDPLSYAMLTNRGDLGIRIYTPLSVHFQNTFNTELLLKIPRNAFLPVKRLKINKKSSHCIQLAKEEGDLLYLIKVTGRPELARLRELDQMSAFYNFVSQVFNVRSNRLIPFLEQWIPGCGPKLIAKGYSVYTLTGELKPEEAHSIFMDICLPYDDGLTFSSGLGNLTLNKPSSDDLEDYDDP